MRAVLLALILLPTMASATDVQGTLTTHTVWKRSGSPYVLKGDVTVAWGTRLTLEPGVQVIASSEDALRSGVDPQRVELIVDGTLVVRGTAARPVELTSRGGSGSWYGIRVRGGRGTVIDGAVITQAHQGISLGMSAVVRNTSVSATTEDCLHVSWGKATLEDNRLSGCGKNGLYVGQWAQVQAERTVVTGSGGNGLELHGEGELHHNTLHGNAAPVHQAHSARVRLSYDHGHDKVWSSAARTHGPASITSPGPSTLRHAILSEPRVRGRSVFANFSRSTRSGGIVAHVDWRIHRPSGFPSSGGSAALLRTREHPPDARMTTSAPTGDPASKIARRRLQSWIIPTGAAGALSLAPNIPPGETQRLAEAEIPPDVPIAGPEPWTSLGRMRKKPGWPEVLQARLITSPGAPGAPSPYT